MAIVTFYEKPGCGNNSKQKMLLAQAGHTVWAKSLLTELWTRERLLQFFGNKRVTEWFNRAAPKIKSGEINPENIDAETAIAMMLADPLLIRRPLIEVEGRREIGFDAELIDAWLGLNKSPERNLETCNKSHQEKSCS
ncbi:MAG TPA: ArsC/Spx/MgsR family protein [Methylophilaceae bacterium]|jgi:nitrogenase-associated protein